MPKTRHRLTGVEENDTPQHIIDHPVLGKYLEVVDERSKPIPAALIKNDEETASRIARVSRERKAESEEDNS